MKPVPSKRKHLSSRVTADEVAFYYAKKCHVLPQVYLAFIEHLTYLETHERICFTPAAVLERYHLNLAKKREQLLKKVSTNSR